jgi:hypothetical protein
MKPTHAQSNRQTEEVAAPQAVSNPPCTCKHSFGAHRPQKGCVFCDCASFLVETPAGVIYDGKAESIVEMVARNPAFSHVTADHLADLTRVGRKREYLRRTALVREGDASDRIFLLLEGTVKVETGGGDGWPRHIANLGPGEFFGEMGALYGQPRSATVTSVGEVVALELTLDQLRDIFSQDSDLILGFARLIRSRKTASR